MSETKDEFIYNFYDYMKTVFIYSHVKTYLIDPSRQEDELASDQFLLYFSLIMLIFNYFKIFIIILYFAVLQSSMALFKKIKILCISGFKINYKASCKNTCEYIFKILKRIVTFNFNLYENNYIGTLMILTYLTYLVVSVIFYEYNLKYINDTEKSKIHLSYFYLHFETTFLMQILCSSFYSCRNMKIATICAFSIWAILNAFMFVIYFIKEIMENVEGYYENDDFVKIDNIAFNTVFLFLNGKSFFNILLYKKQKEHYNLLLKEKEAFYKKIDTNDNYERLIRLEQKIIEGSKKFKYEIEKVYYSLDGKNIFKRKDRYNYKILQIKCCKIYSNLILSIIFFLLSAINLFEIIFNIVLFINRKHSYNYNESERKATLIVNMFNIALIQILSTMTVVKLKIETYIYY